MKTILLISLLFSSVLSLCQDSLAQTARYQTKRYNAWIELNNLENLEGYVLSVNDSGIYYLTKANLNSPLQSIFIHFKDISIMKFRYNGKKAIGLIMGAGLGLGIGLAVYSAKKDPFTNNNPVGVVSNAVSNTASATGAVGGGLFLGGLLGLAVGSGKDKVEIYGNPQPSSETLNLLTKYTLFLEL